MNKKSISERFPNCHNPALRWIPRDFNSLHFTSALNKPDVGEETVKQFCDVADFCAYAGDCSPDTMLTDIEWRDLIHSMVGM